MSKIYKKCYVYKIINDIDDNIYIGSTSEKLCKRMVWHRSDAQKEKCSNYKLYVHFKLIGVEHFKIVLIEEYQNIDRQTLRKHEDEYIRINNSVKIGLNGAYASGHICEHNRERARCKECESTVFCEHNRVKYSCKDCNGIAICEHKHLKYSCKDCDGSMLCIHKKIKYTCKDCDGSSICIHERIKYNCKDCNGSSICEHNICKYRCKACGGNSICEHQRERRHCAICNDVKCEYCNKKISSKTYLKKHMLICKKKIN